MSSQSKTIRWNAWMRWVIFALLLTNVLLATGMPALAQVEPTLHVVPAHPEVHGHDWPGDVVVTLIIDGDDDPDNGILYTDWKYASDDPWCGTPCFDLQGVFDIQPGQVVTLSDAETFKLVTVTSLQVTAVDPVADTVSGTAAPYSAVQVDIQDEGGVSRNVIANEYGNWVADFAVVGDEDHEQNTYDLGPGSQGRAIQFEVDGYDDGTLAYWNVPNPAFSVRPEEDQIDGWEWQAGTEVILSIGGQEYDRQVADGWGNVSFDLQGILDIQVGDVVTLSDGDTTKVHTVANIAVTGLDPTEDIVSGTAAPNSEITVWTHDGRANLQVTADVNGIWSADLTDQIDLIPGQGGGAAIYDDDQDSTAVYWWIPNPSFSARPEEDRVQGWEWPPNSSVTVSVDVDTFSGNAGTDEWGNFDLNLDGFDLQPGQLVTVSGSGSTKSHIVTGLTITGVDPDLDTVSGTAAAGSQVQAWICDEGGCANREETADGSGYWMVDFAHPGDQDWEQDIRDIRPGTGGDAAQWDDDGDSTQIGWQVLNPTFAARPDQDRVQGWEWPLGEMVTIEIDDPGTGPGTDYSDTQTVGVADWDPNQTYVQFDFQGLFQLQPGYVVTLTAGTTTKSHTVTNLDVIDVDTSADTVSGTADAGSNVDVWSCDEQGCVSRHVVADGEGVWTANFAVAGPRDDEQDTLDIVNGTGGDVSQSDDDGDSTQLRWEEAHPRLEVSYEHDWVQIRGFTPGGEVTYTIYDYEGGHALFGPVTGPVDSHGDGWISYNLHHIDLIPGNYVVAVNEASGEEVSLLIRDLNLDYVGVEDDRAFGTAEPNSTIELNISESYDHGFDLMVSVDGSGYWEVDLADEGHAIDSYRHAQVNLYDAEGDNVTAQAPRIVAQVSTDSFGVDNFSKNADVTFTLYESPSGPILYGPETLHTDSSGNVWVNLWEQGIDLLVGHYIVAYDHTLDFSKELWIEPFTFDEMNTTADYVRGTSLVDEWVELHVESLFSNWGMDALTDEYEQWYRDYGVEDYDITDQMWAYGWAIDDQGNWSQDHITGLPNIEASIADDWISGFNFTPDRPVRIEIYDSEDGTLLNWLEVTADGNTQFQAENWQHGIDLQPGMYIHVMDTETGKASSLILADLTFDRVDYGEEVAEGQAEPGAQVIVRADWLFEHYEVSVTADTDGNWLADFRIYGADLTPEWSLRAMVFDDELDATVADAPRPPEFGAAFDQDWVNGNNWSPNSDVQIEILADANAIDPLHTILWGTDEYGNFHADLWRESVDLQQGQRIVVTDVATNQSKATTLVNLTIESVDPEADLVEGFAPGDTRISVDCWNDSFGDGFDLFSEGDGTWQADFGAHDIDLTSDTSCDARVYDEDNDATQANWHASNPTFAARPVDDAVEGWEWPLDAVVTVAIDQDGDPDTAECERTTTVIPAPWDPQTSWFRVEFQGDCDLVAGDTVTASDGQTTKTHVVTSLQVVEVSSESNIVSGIAGADSEVNLWIHGEEGTDLWETADESGHWTADFTGTFDLQPGTGGAAVQRDDDGDQTWIDWEVPNPTFLVRLLEDEVHGYGWPIGANVTLTIDDPDTPENPDYSETGTVVEAPWDPEQTFVRFGYEDPLSVDEGFLVIMTDGEVTKDHTVTSLALTSVDAGLDLVTGTAEPGSEVRVDACDDFGCASRLELTSSGSIWSADFAVPGQEDWEQDIFDIGPGTGGEAVQQDEDGDGTQVGWWIPVGNQPPTIESITPPVDPIAISDQPVSVEVGFSDPDTGDVHTVTWDWGDGSSDTMNEAVSPASAEHAYEQPGVYRVEVTVTDAAGASDAEVYEFIVIYDPEGGFVTGGGWIWSPTGAYTADPMLEGKASFGFVSKYKKGASIPEGQTQFQFKTGGLNFHSDTYDWLVVAGAKAKFKGVGTINGVGNYGFMLTAIDSKLTPSTDVDLFRIKIWDKDDGDAIIYDNQIGDLDDADPTTAISEGSIVVHKTK